jgi:outer membrane receptor protein involved in Fe transport
MRQTSSTRASKEISSMRPAQGTLSLAAAVALVLQVAPAVAADDVFDEITVTATRRAEHVQDIPYSISAISGEKLAEAGIADIASMTRGVAGITSFDSGAGGNDNRAITIRGLNSGGLNTNQTVAPVATYVNETPLFLNLRLKDIDRVEVLRGPQGTLYGSGSLGGTVRFIQHQPELSNFDLQASVGSSSTTHASGLNSDADLVVNLPVIKDVFAIRLNASYAKDQGFIDAPNLYQLDGTGTPVPQNPSDLINSPAVLAPRTGTNVNEYKSGRIAAFWKLSPGWQASVNVFHQQATSGDSQTVTPLAYATESLQTNRLVPETLSDRVDLQSLEIEGDVGFARFSSATSHFRHTDSTILDYTSEYETFPFYTPYYGANPRPLYAPHQGLDDTGTVQEFRLTSQGTTAYEWVAGLFLENEHTDTTDHEFGAGYQKFFDACAPVYGATDLSTSPPTITRCGLGTFWGVTSSVAGIPIVYDQTYIGDSHSDFKDRALFGEFTWHVSKAWQVTTGVRAFTQSFEQSQQSALLFDGPDFASNASRSISDRHVLYKLNTSYKLDGGTMLYATYSQGYRRGGVNALPASTVAGGPTNPILYTLKPDFAYNTEFGVKGSVARFVEYSASVYSINWKDVQSGLYLTPISIISTANLGKAYSRGLELELTAHLAPGLTSQVAYSYDATKLTEISEQAALATVPSVPGGSLPGAPKNTFFGRLEYRSPVADGWDATWDLDAYYRGPMLTATTANRFPLPGYTTADASVSIGHGAYHLLVYARNLTNKIALNSGANSDIYGAGASALVTRPRTVGIALSYALGQR